MTLSALLRKADTHLAPHRFAEGPSGLLCKAKASVVANIARSQWPPRLQTRGAAVCVWRQSYKVFRILSGRGLYKTTGLPVMGNPVVLLLLQVLSERIDNAVLSHPARRQFHRRFSRLFAAGIVEVQ